MPETTLIVRACGLAYRPCGRQCGSVQVIGEKRGRSSGVAALAVVMQVCGRIRMSGSALVVLLIAVDHEASLGAMFGCVCC